jgi:hypothetical protein
MARKRKKVYIAAPYTRPDPCVNVHAVIGAANRLMDAGVVPFVPHLCHLWHTVTPRPYADWTAWDLEWIAACNALLRLPGESPGADAEVAEAVRLGIPVFYTEEGLLAWAA